MEAAQLLFNLIKLRSYSGEEAEIANYISRYFEALGVKVCRHEGNLYIQIGGLDKSKAFIFNSHMDTVNAGDEKAWKYGACNPTLENEMVVGLGASDMKSGLAASMILAKQYINEKPPIDMWFTYVVKEEEDGSGSKNFAKWFETEGYLKAYKEVAAIFTEPTNLDEIEYGHRGNIFLKAVSLGDTGHASRPKENKKHAVLEMVNFAKKLEEQVGIWAKEFEGGVFDPPTVAIMTSVQAGVIDKNGEIVTGSVNKFPGSCTATFDLRTVPGFHEVAFEKIVKLGKKMGIEVSYLFDPAPSGLTDTSDKIVKIASQVIGEKVKLIVTQGAADMGFFSQLGVKAIILGPGLREQCHQTNEMAPLGHIPKAVEIYHKIVTNWSKN